MKIKDMVLCSIFAAILCVFSVISLPIGPVSVTLGVFGVLLTSLMLDTKRAVISVLVFILIGAVGLPVFSGFGAGISVIVGPTGGYITSYVFMALIIGLLTKRMPQNKAAVFAIQIASCIAGLIICYLLGTLQYMAVRSSGIIEALLICVVPFIPFDIAKIICAVIISDVMKRTPIKKYLS